MIFLILWVLFRAEDYIKAIRAMESDSLKIIVALVPNNKKDRYDAIKKHCCIDQPIPSQVSVVPVSLIIQRTVTNVSFKSTILLYYQAFFSEADYW